jgi:hypothetical protein
MLLATGGCVGVVGPWGASVDPEGEPGGTMSMVGPPGSKVPGGPMTPSMETTPAPGALGADFVRGEILYGTLCADCHGPLSSSTKKGKSFLAVTNAVQEIPQMAPLKGHLTDDDIRKIIFALDFERTAVCESSTLTRATRVSRLTRQEYLHAISDVLGIAPFATFALDFEADGEKFDNDSQLLTVNSKWMGGYLAAAEEAIGRARAAKSPILTELLACGPDAGTCLSAAFGHFGRLAYRRTLTPDELDKLLALYTQARMSTDHAGAVATVLTASLVSPNFVFKNYAHPSTPGVFQLDAHQLATRLAFFLWSAPPDGKLLDLADQGTLRSRDVLAAEVSRMLRDPKARRFTTNFFQQWLGIRSYASDAPPQGISTELRDAFVRESQRFFDEILENNLSTAAILDGNFTFVDENLAKHYGMSAVTGTTLRKVPLDGTPRLGFLSQGSFLTANGSPTGRGKWILLNMLCMMPGPVPMMVDLSEENKALDVPFKEKVRLHAAKADCRGCHAEMDPFGFSLEKFGPDGRWRTNYEWGEPVDTSGTLDGVPFADHRDLVRLVSQRSDFQNCFAQKLVSYATARDLSTEERCSANGIAQRAAAKNLGIRDQIVEVVLDELFTHNLGGN